MGKLTFEKYKKEIEKLNEEEKIKKIFSDIGCENGAQIFYGEISSDRKFITAIHKINSNENMEYPYETKTKNAVSYLKIILNSEDNYKPKSKVLFLPACGSLGDEDRLLEAKEIKKIDEIFVGANFRQEDMDFEDCERKELSADGFEAVKNRLKYNYEDYKVRLFLAALNTSQIIALCGKPGTGKTTFAEQMAEAIGARFHMIEVQNNWTDSTDLLGFYNPANNTYQPTKFLDALLLAKKDMEKYKDKAPLHIICLDEMNLSRVEYYFATFLSLLQRDKEKRKITLLPPGTVGAGLEKYKDFIFPQNVRFAGTMNMDDTAQFLSPKVIDRAIFIEFDGKKVPEEKEGYSEEEAYLPCKEFDLGKAKQADISGCIEKLKEVADINPRLENYVRGMWPVYEKIAGNEGEELKDFTDLIILSKILPSIDKAIDETKLEPFDKSRERCKTDGNNEDWSYWE